MLFTAVSAHAEKRVAFVVVTDLQDVAQLPNPAVDAKAMAGALRNVGFDVVEGTNLTRDKIDEKLARLRQEGARRRCRRVSSMPATARHQRPPTNLLPHRLPTSMSETGRYKLGAAINIDLDARTRP